MISSVFSLKEANTIPEYLVPNEETKLECNYYESSLDFLLECQEELLSCRRDFYKTVLESNENQYVINEAFNDVLQRIKEIIKKILAYIESIIKRFITSLNKFVSSDKYIIKMKKEISKFPSNGSFTINGYNYTLDDNIPIVDIVGLDLTEVKSALEEIEKDNSDIGVKLAKLEVILSELTSDRKMDEIRSHILNTSYNISDNSFANEVFAIYRDGKSSEQSIDIRKADVNRAMDDYEGYKDKIKKVNTLKSDISSKYKSLESQIDYIVKTNIKESIEKSNADPETKSVLTNRLSNLVTSQAQSISKIANYHVQAIAAKLDAYNALVIQDRNILYTALNMVNKDINNSRIMENTEDYNYTRDNIYKSYLIESFYMNKEQQRFVEECLALSESNIPELKTIHEDLKMDVKGKFEKLKAMLKEIFQKFLMKMNKFFTNDKTFLEKYKDVILTKKVEEYALNNMPDYEAGIKNIKAHKLKKLDIKNILSKTEAEIQKELLPAFDGNDFTDFAKRYFLCNNTPNREKVQSTTLNMAEIYAFCLGAPAAIKALENDQKEFAAAADAAKNAVLQVSAKNEAIDMVGKKYYYSSVLESFINEDGEKAAEQQPAQSGGEAKANTNLKLDVPTPDNKAKENENLDKDVKSDDKGKDAETQAKENKGSDSKKVQETATWYLNTIRTITTAKITAFQKIYSEYMKILRYHVQQATGSMGNASKFSEDDTKQIKSAMQDYLKGDDSAKKTAADKIISIYKSKGMVIDAHDVQTLVEKNKGSLG